MNPVHSLTQLWQSGIEPNLRDLLLRAESDGDTVTEREQWVVELICADMRFRWLEKKGATKDTESYLNDLPATFAPFSSAAIAQLRAYEAKLRTLSDSSLQNQRNLDTEQLSELADLYRTQAPEGTGTPSTLPAKETHHDQTTDPLAGQSAGLSTQLPQRDPLQDTDVHRSKAPQERLPPTAQPTYLGLGRYRILKKLGSGAFGDVYLSHDEKLHRHVAIKVPRKKFLDHSSMVSSFLIEARTAAGLDHPGIVTTHDVVEQPDGTIFIVMEYIDGGTLQELMDQDAKSGTVLQRMGVHFVASVAYQASLALAEAHHHGLIHRDLKPANLMLKEDKVRITDFGLAVPTSETQQSSQIAGTPAYMSPEQTNESLTGLDGRADIWSLGVILYQLCTGQLPFDGKIRELFDKIKNDPLVSPRSLNKKIPEQLELIILRCLEKNRDDRYRSVLELADDLRPLTVAKPQGFKWEYVLVPVGVILTMLGTALGMAYTGNLLFSFQFFTTPDLISYGLESFLIVAVTLGLGPPLLTAGNWFCCRRCKTIAGNTPTIPCKVSRWSIGCIAAGTASAGFGPPMYLLAIGLGVCALISVRRRKRWLTGTRHAIAGLSLGLVLLLPSLFFWYCFFSIYRTVDARQRFDQALELDDDTAAATSLATIERLSSTFPIRMNGGVEMASVFQARLALQRQEYESALTITDEAAGRLFTGQTTRLYIAIVRAIAILRSGDQDKAWQLKFEKESIASILDATPFSVAPWAEAMIAELEPFEPTAESNLLFGPIQFWPGRDASSEDPPMDEPAAPAPPAPLMDSEPSACLNRGTTPKHRTC